MSSDFDIYHMNSYTLLKQLGCSRDESRTFDALMKHPKGITVVSLAKKLNKPRATLYDHLKALTKKGLVTNGRTDAGSVFYPESPEGIRGVFNERSHELARSGVLIEEYIQESSHSDAYNPHFSVIDNAKAAETIFRDALRSGVKESYWFWPARALFHKSVPDEVFDYWHNERIRRGMHVKVLWPPKQKVPLAKNSVLGSGNDKVSLRQICILPNGINGTLGYGIYGNKVGFISSAQENYGFIVDSKEFAETLKSQFDFFWKVSKKRK